MTTDLVGRTNAWYVAARRPLPWREPGVTAWGVLVSEIMLQQTQAARVAPRWLAFLQRWPTPDALAGASDAEVLRAWDRLGYPRRALRLRQCAAVIAERHGGVVPRDEAQLLALPGIGPYTAAAVACFAYGEPTAVVDTNVRRVLARAVLGAAEPWAPAAARDAAEYRAVVPVPADPQARARAVTWNAAAMELGAVVCTAKAPACEQCPVASLCAWRQAGSPVGTVAGRPRPRQAAYAGSDRQLRGAVLRVLRDSPGGTRIDLVHPELGIEVDAARFERVLTGLEADGLVARRGVLLALPGEQDC